MINFVSIYLFDSFCVLESPSKIPRHNIRYLKLNKPPNNWGGVEAQRKSAPVIYLDVDYNNYESEYPTDLVTNRLRQRFGRLKTPLKIIILLAIEICLVVENCQFNFFVALPVIVL